MSIETLYEEYRTEIIGSKIYELIKKQANFVRKYPPDIYNYGRPWQENDINDICDETILELLIEKKQIQYIFDQIRTLDSVKKLINFNIRRAVIARARKGPIDRLRNRLKQLAKDGEIQVQTVSGLDWYSSAGMDPELGQLLPSEVTKYADQVRHIPRLVSRSGTSRETMIYTPKDFREVVSVVLGEGKAISDKDFEGIFKVLLTPWDRTTLTDYKDDDDYGNQQSGRSQAIAAMTNQIMAFAHGLTLNEQIVLFCKGQNISDTDLAVRFGISRPTVVGLKKKVFKRVKAFLLEIENDDRGSAMAILLDNLNLVAGAATQ